MRTLKFWYNEWQHSYNMLIYWENFRDNAKRASVKMKAQAITEEYHFRCALAFEQIMRCFNV